MRLRSRLNQPPSKLLNVRGLLCLQEFKETSSCFDLRRFEAELDGRFEEWNSMQWEYGNIRQKHSQLDDTLLVCRLMQKLHLDENLKRELVQSTELDHEIVLRRRRHKEADGMADVIQCSWILFGIELLPCQADVVVRFTIALRVGLQEQCSACSW